jgi:DNA-binding MarR family transcriptional regulator
MKAQTIRERMIDRAPNATRLMDKLCDKNLIERERCEDDRRVVYVRITNQGLALLSTIDNNENLSFLENITQKEAIILSDLLDKIR